MGPDTSLLLCPQSPSFQNVTDSIYRYRVQWKQAAGTMNINLFLSPNPASQGSEEAHSPQSPAGNPPTQPRVGVAASGLS